MVLRNCFKRNLDSLVGVKAYLVHEAVKSPLVENCLHSAEHGFNGVELGAVSDVKDGRDVEFHVKWL